MDAVVEALQKDVAALQDAGVDGLLFCNEHDIPYQLEVGPEIPAAMAAAVGRLRSEIRKPFGVDILWDPKAALAVARATGAAFVREVFTGVFESDLGMIEPNPGDLAGYRQSIGAQDVALFTNITPEFSRSVGNRTVAERARGAAFLGYDALLISGPAAGASIEMDELKAARKAVPDIPVLANTGVNHANIKEILPNCDGVIVGTSLKVDGNTWNPVDPARARQMVELVGRIREQVPAR
jgi:membrane complex biogenesis BtpA family protein